MSRLTRWCLCIMLLTNGLRARPNFSLLNSTADPIHFIILGVDDLFALTNSKIERVPITTIEPGGRYEATIALKGVLPKPPHFAIFPHGEGEQQTMPLKIKTTSHKYTFAVPIGSIRIFELHNNKEIALEMLPEYDLRPAPGARIADGEIRRAYPYEALERWALDSPEHLRTFCKFQSTFYPFVYELVRSGGVARFLWRWPLRGLPWALGVKWAEINFRSKTGISLVPQEAMNVLSSGLGLSAS